jgi:hypothetical protein
VRDKSGNDKNLGVKGFQNAPKGNKDMEKKGILKIIGKVAMVLLPPLLIVYGDAIIPPIIPFPAYTIIGWGIPLSLIIAYGYITGDKITSTLSGVLLWPLCGLYSYIIEHGFMLSWRFLFHLLFPWGPFLLFIILCGLAGYLASRRGKISLSIAIALASLFIYFLTTIPD